MVLAVVVAAAACLFAADAVNTTPSKLSVGVSAGVATDTLYIYEKGNYGKAHFDEYGFDVNVRADYAFSDKWSATAVLDWEILSALKVYSKEDFFARYRTEKIDIPTNHTLAIMAGISRDFDLKYVHLAISLGPNFKVNLNDGDIDLGAKAIAKVSYELPSNPLTVDLSLMNEFVFVSHNKFFTEYSNSDLTSLFINNSIGVGMTYKF